MPLIQVFTSAAAPTPAATTALLSDLSRLVCQTFDKPLSWGMTCLMPQLTMTFGGTSAPACFVNVRNVGKMTPAQTTSLSRDLCARLTEGLQVPADRVFIEFGDATDYLWGWNGETFA